MSVDEKTVVRIAHLARLKLPPDEIRPMVQELNALLGWISQLSDVDTQSVSPMTSAVHQSLRWRPDVVGADPEIGGGRQADVIANAPESQLGFYSVPKVIES